MQRRVQAAEREGPNGSGSKRPGGGSKRKRSSKGNAEGEEGAEVEEGLEGEEGEDGEKKKKRTKRPKKKKAKVEEVDGEAAEEEGEAQAEEEEEEDGEEGGELVEGDEEGVAQRKRQKILQLATQVHPTAAPLHTTLLLHNYPYHPPSTLYSPLPHHPLPSPLSAARVRIGRGRQARRSHQPAHEGDARRPRRRDPFQAVCAVGAA